MTDEISDQRFLRFKHRLESLSGRDDGNVLSISNQKGILDQSSKSGTEAQQRNWCDHWKQYVWFILGKGIPISKSEEVHLHAVHTDTSVSYNLVTPTTEISTCDASAGDSHLTLSPKRIEIVHPLRVVTDDSVFLSLLVTHLSKTPEVISLFLGLRERVHSICRQLLMLMALQQIV
ncbi:unnamed protein product [Dovyalis caffra]|uniref:Uncharacterized protein n=1 Tax=Dovyalis caffra TaxID=77055 RepID=A0AAV1SUA1_9ROSI|nr:unnamed protein product [Dovyalis caffra]